jgi:hypothetical protein
MELKKQSLERGKESPFQNSLEINMYNSYPEIRNSNAVALRESSQIILEPKTGPLEAIKDEKTLILLDCENLSISAEKLCRRFSYKKLSYILHSVTSEIKIHAFFSRRPQDERRVKYFIARDFIPHPREIVSVQNGTTTKRFANSDFSIAFHSGLLVSRSSAKTVILGSGDGELVSEIASFLTELPSKRRIFTLSLPGSTSWRLKADKNSNIEDNIEVGEDILHKMTIKSSLFQNFTSKRRYLR